MIKTECPDKQILRQYLLGECPDSVSNDVERHLESCPACEDTIAQFDTSADTLMRHLPLAAAAASDSDRATKSPGWIDLLRQQPPADRPPAISFAAPEKHQEAVQTEPDPPLADGFANYSVLGILGRGGMGIVFLARHKQLNRKVALKVVRPDALSSEMAKRRFQREIQILGGLNHPGIVMATDAGIVGRGAYLVMEWIDGVDFGHLVRQTGPLAVDAACEAGRQIAEALAAAHRTGVIHRDVKPSNTMVDCDGRVRLLDFGLAHMTRQMQESGDTSIGRLLGTLDYMAPEQAEGENQVDARSDLYALGAMLFFLLTGRPPHGAREGRSILEQIRSVVHEAAPRVKSLRIDVPEQLDDLIAKLLSRDPSDRPDSATWVATKLETWAGGDLAVRVTEYKSKVSVREQESTAESAARQSLAELIGDPLIPPNVTDSRVTKVQTDRPSRRPRLWWLAILPVLVLAVAAVTVVLKTPQGTLRIESEVENVEVELVNENEVSRELQIKSGSNETQLRAGQYRLRFRQTHDDLEFDRDVITLRRGGNVMVRITRTPEPSVAPQKNAQGGEGLYKGRTETDWKRQFQLETEPASKLEAARALLSLASVLPPREQFERILDVGEEIVRSGWNEPYFGFVYSNAGVAASNVLGLKWPQSHAMEIQKAYAPFRNDLSDQTRKLPFGEIGELALDTIVKGNDARAAFSAALISERMIVMEPAGTEPAGWKSLILGKLDVPVTGADRSAVCQLLRLSLARSLTHEQRKKMLWHSLTRLADELQNAPKTSLRHVMIGRMLSVSHDMYGEGWPPELSELLARIVLERMTSPMEMGTTYFGGMNDQFFGGMNSPSGFTFVPTGVNSMTGMPMGGMGGGMGGTGMFGGMSNGTNVYMGIYEKEVILALRESNRHYLESWVKVANDYVQSRVDQPIDYPMFNVIRSLEIATRICSEKDDWPIETTAKLFTAMLHHYYDAPFPGRNDIPPNKRAAPNSVPGELFRVIVRITGQIPDFVRKGPLASQSVQKRLDQFDRLSKPDAEFIEDPFNEFGRGLLYEAPYETIRFICHTELLRNSRLSGYSSSTADLLSQFAYQSSAVTPLQMDLRMDPLLLLAILADLAGETWEYDTDIAKFFIDQNFAKSFWMPVTEILESQLREKENTRQWLEMIISKSKSDKLTEGVRNLLKTADNPDK